MIERKNTNLGSTMEGTEAAPLRLWNSYKSSGFDDDGGGGGTTLFSVFSVFSDRSVVDLKYTICFKTFSTK